MPPDDINPESGCRLPLPRREDLDEAAQRLYDSLKDPKGGSLVGLRGPGGIRLHSPKVAVLAQPMSRYLRWDCALGGRVRELAILATAREFDSQFEWTAHEPAALAEGVPPATVEIIKHRRATAGLPEKDAIVIELGREIFRAKKVSSVTYARALEQFGAKDLVDLVSLMGIYAATAAILCAFDMQLPAGKSPPLPVG